MSRRSGFTLLELLVVIGIMMVLTGISAVAFLGIRRGSELRGAVGTVRTTLMLTRQMAVTKRQTVNVSFNKTDNSISVIYGVSGKTNKTVWLTPGVELLNSDTISYTPAGGTSGGVGGTKEITIKEKTGVGTGARTIKVWLLTGGTTERDTSP